MSGPQHPMAQRFLKHGLFHNVESFPELESRISQLPTRKEKGDAFEVFAEAYLTNQKVVNAAKVWPFEAIPLEYKQKLGIDLGSDMGVDGALLDSRELIQAYQAKFRGNRKKLTWSQISTFMGLSDQASQRILFTNSESLPRVLKDRTGFYAIKGTDLDRLRPDDFHRFELWLKGSPAPLKRKRPLKHQVNAIEDIVSALRSDDRATVLMACGTGKTLIGLWVAEKLKARTILVLVPSLALLSQTLHEWFKETNWFNPIHICVCSDPSVEKERDGIVLDKSDIDFPVSTNPIEVKRFLNYPHQGAKVVFCTYHSQQVIAEGSLRGKFFDLAIFDEAHKTASRKGAKFGQALNDGFLSIRKRLFMTATPRHYDLRKRNKDDDALLVYSMDSTEDYGPVCHKLSFARAANLNIICQYKVLVSVVTSKMLNEKLLRIGEVLVDGDPIRAHYVAQQIALRKAIEKYPIKKVFTFHPTVKGAKTFTNPSGEHIKNHLPDFKAYHVNGKMSVSKREQYMRSFRMDSKAIMTNARCLVEGVDIPAVDMVAFMSPKYSKLDIIQATGRAMRKSKNTEKEFGYVIIPVFLEQEKGETVEDAVERSNFDEVWLVLQALQEQDEVFADIVTTMREQKGKTGGYDPTRFNEKVEFLGPEIKLETIQKAITARSVERLTCRWDERYGQLKAFYEENGHTLIRKYDHPDNKFVLWVKAQRALKNMRLLSEERKRKLEDINFAFNYHDAKWEQMFQTLKEYKEANGNMMVSPTKNKTLYNWTRMQRKRKMAKEGNKIGTEAPLSDEQLNRLNDIGFDWDANTNRNKKFWKKGYNALKNYFEEKGGPCGIPSNLTFRGVNLHGWAATQRKKRFMKKNISKEKIKLLDDIGFVWKDDKQARGLHYLIELEDFVCENGHCKLTNRTPLGRWLNNQRRLYKKGQLNPLRTEMLDEICPDWRKGLSSPNQKCEPVSNM